MPALQVKNVPEELHEELREEALARGCSIGELVLLAIRKELKRPAMTKWVQEASRQSRVDVSNKDIMDAIDEGRRSR